MSVIAKAIADRQSEIERLQAEIDSRAKGTVLSHVRLLVGEAREAEPKRAAE